MSATWRMTHSEFAATQEKLTKINARAEKRGFTGRFTLVGEAKTVRRDGVDLAVIDAVLTGEPPAYAGWQFLAAVDTVGEGFVLRVAPGVGESGVDRSALVAGRCEHCGMSRRRKYTYLVREQATGRTLQVGSTCIKDFLGWEGRPVFFSYSEVEEDLGWGGGGYSWEPEFTPATVVAVAWAAVQEWGFVPSGDWDRQPTKDIVNDYLVGRSKAANEVREALADKVDPAKGAEVIEALLARGLEGSSDYAQNLRVALGAEFVGARQFGLVASAARAYQRLVEAEVKAAAAPEVVNSKIGAVGQKVTVTGTVSVATTIDGFYGAKRLVVVQTPQGVAKTFTQAAWAWDAEQGQEITLSGTVKEHEEWQGVAQTVLLRPKKV